MALKPARLQWSGDGRLVNLDYDDVYFQSGQALAESDYVFLQHNNLPDRFADPVLHRFDIGELGFGSGLNFLLTAKLFLETAPRDAVLTYVSIEKHPIPRDMLATVYAHWPELSSISNAVLNSYPPLLEGFHTLRLMQGRIRLILCFGDAKDMLPDLHGLFDTWYLDGFSPAKNPDMWQDSLFTHIAAHTKPGGTLTSFSVAGHMRRAFQTLGFDVQKIKGFGIKWSMTKAQKQGVQPPVHKQHIAIIGAGIAGCSVAHALAQRGHRISLIDRHGCVAPETSGNPTAVVYARMTVDTSPFSQFHQHGFSYTRQSVSALGLKSWQPCGVLHMDIDARTRDRYASIINKNTVPADYACKTEEGLYQAQAGFLSPVEFCKALSDHPLITLHRASLSQIHQNNTGWRIACKDAPDITADIVILASGMHTADLPQTNWLPLQSLRGQVTQVKTTPLSEKMSQVICHEGHITPAVDGLHSIGATFQREFHDDFTPRTEDDSANLQNLQKYLPELNITEADIVKGRSGFRANTPDKLPLIGPAPDYTAFCHAFAPLRRGVLPADVEKPYFKGLYICTGFGAHGMTGAPLAGEIIAALIDNTPLPVPASLAKHLLPERFILRDLKRQKI